MRNSRIAPFSSLPFRWRLDFSDIQTGEIYPAWQCRIDEVFNIIGIPTTTILLNGLPYVLGDEINEGDVVNITVSVASVIDLNIEL